MRTTFHIFKKWILQNKIIQYIIGSCHPLMKNPIESYVKYPLTDLI